MVQSYRMHKKNWEGPFQRQLIVMKQDSLCSHLITDSHLVERSWAQGSGLGPTVQSCCVGGGEAVEGRMSHYFLENSSPVTRPLCDLKMSKDNAIG